MDDSSSKSTETRDRRISPMSLVLVAGWAVVVACLGGYACGLAISKFGTLGAVSLWLVGEAAGFVGKRLVVEKSRMAGVFLVVACIGAFLFAEVCWIRWHTVQGEAGWLAAIGLLSTFVKEYSVAAAVGGIFCGIGANSAYRQVARRYRIVHIVED
jgi:hypothetical protein